MAKTTSKFQIVSVDPWGIPVATSTERHDKKVDAMKALETTTPAAGCALGIVEVFFIVEAKEGVEAGETA